jgi:Tfp pilus assembly protein PilE
LVNKVGDVEHRMSANTKRIIALEDDGVRMRDDIQNLFRLSDEFRKEMDELSQKVAELYVLKKQMADQQAFVDELAQSFETFTGNVNSYMQENTTHVERLQQSNDDTVFKLKEMQEYVDHFADNLVLNSQQIMVDSQAGFNSKPMNLTDVLRACSSNFLDLGDSNKIRDEQLAKAFSELDTKAPDSVLFNVSTLEKKVATIELHIKKEEEQGLGALRKTCEELSIHMQTMQTELAEKIDRESAGFMVHEKYEEIVKYLQDALQSSLEDENNFKEKADEIQEMVVLLSNSKADRTEIANMQEVMVKSEALLKKVGAQANFKEKMKELVTREEMEEMLAEKVDRSEFSAQLQNVVATTRRSKKLTSMSTDLPSVQDEIYAPPSSASSKLRVIRASNNADVAASPDGGQSKPIPVIALGQSLSGSNSPKGYSEFGNYVKTKGPKKSIAMSSSLNSLPSADAPGSFRKASESGRSGGQVDFRGNAAALEGYGPSEYPYVADPNSYKLPYTEQSAATDQLAYLHGPLVGGGFNARSAHILRSLPGNRSVQLDDVEGKGL